MADNIKAEAAGGQDLVFAHYRILHRSDGSIWELGRGAMGVTYKAFDEQLRIHVALKVITPAQIDDATTQALFLREARAAARVRHPNVASVVYLNATPGHFFYAMEFIAGESLADWMRKRGALPTAWAIGFAIQIARGLGAIHQQHIVHRDLKPANLMVVAPEVENSGVDSELNFDAWQIKIIDFGLARGFAGEALGTEVNAKTIGFRGTALYASPEQCEERGQIDGRSDLYSLGCILWEMLAGLPPFYGRTHRELLNQHVAQNVPLERIAHLPQSVKAILSRLLAKDADDRFANADAVIRALEHCHESSADAVEENVDTRVISADAGQGSPAKVSHDARARRGSRSLRLVGMALGVIALSLVLVWWRPWQGGSITGSGKTAVAKESNSVAVLPFVNMSADKGDEYLSDGMTEELLSVLSKVKGLRVPGRTSSFAFKGRTEDGIFRRIGEELHVNTVLEGSVRKAGEKLRITAQLIKVADGYHLWSETYDGNMNDILAVQSDVAQRVVRALQVQLGTDEERALAKKPTENPEAYRLYMLGRYHFFKWTQAGWINAIRYFEEALKVDPNYALAYCGLADLYGWSGGQALPGREAWAKEKELALKALAIEPNLAEAHLSFATALFSTLEDLPRSNKELDRALELNPKLAMAYDQYSWNLMAMGRYDDALVMEGRALELDTLNPLFNADLGFFLQWARRYDEAIVQLRKTLELDANNAYAHMSLGWCYIWTGRASDAVSEFQEATALDDLPFYFGGLGYAFAVAGERAKAEQILRDLDVMAKTRYVLPAAQVYVYLGLGEKEKALDWLGKSFGEQDPILWWINGDRLYDEVRNAPRFRELMKNAGFDRTQTR